MIHGCPKLHRALLCMTESVRDDCQVLAIKCFQIVTDNQFLVLLIDFSEIRAPFGSCPREKTQDLIDIDDIDLVIILVDFNVFTYLIDDLF